MQTGRKYINRRFRSRRIERVNECISLKAFADKRFVSTSTVRYWIATGRIVAYKIRGRWYVNENL